MCFVPIVRHACCGATWNPEHIALPITVPCSAATTGGTIDRSRSDPEWTGCPNRSTDLVTDVKPDFPLVCRGCKELQNLGTRIHMVRRHAGACSEWLRAFVNTVEHSPDSAMPPTTKEPYIHAALCLAEVSAYARLSVAPVSNTIERDANRAKTVAAYAKYLSALGLFYRAMWLAHHPAQPSNDVPAVPGGGPAAQSGTGS